MKSKDVALRDLEQHDDVFADIVYAFALEKGFQICAGELSERSETVGLWIDKKGIRSQSRDVVKYWSCDRENKAIIGLENQSSIDRYMPLRVCAYDGGDYKYQVARLCDVKEAQNNPEPMPVMTIVVYVGTETKWEKPLQLADSVTIGKSFKPYITNNTLNIINVAWLEPSVIRRFKSDFRHVADMCRQLRLYGSYKPGKKLVLTHPYEFAQVWYAFTQDPRIAEFFSDDDKQEAKMCEFLDSIEKRGEKRGRKEGRKEGIEEGEKRGEKRGKKTERDNIKLVVNYLKKSGKLDKLPAVLENRRSFSRYLTLALAGG